MAKLTKKEFQILYHIMRNKHITQRELSEICGYSLGNINLTYRHLKDSNLINNNGITETGFQTLDPFKVDNAIIFAAGMSTRFAPFSYEKPKGLTVVKGEVLIERQIRQLKEAGIEEIIVVLGHMLEKFLYLKEKYDIKFVVNNDYRFKNTHSSLYAARDFMKNTYICCSDNYFPTNVFRSHEYQPIYSTLYMDGIQRGERGVISNNDGLIIETQRPAVNQWVLNGYAYFDRGFSSLFRPILEECYGKQGTDPLYWEQIYAEHVDILKLYERRYQPSEVLEFDSVEDLEKFDKDYIKYNDSKIIENIQKTLHCDVSSIHGIKPLPTGLTNKSFCFLCNKQKYVYRSPGKSSIEFINRSSETRAMEIVKDLGIDTSFLYEDAKEGWKISRYITTTEKFNFSNLKHLKMLCNTLRLLHSCDKRCGKSIDYSSMTDSLLGKIKDLDLETYQAATKTYEQVNAIHKHLKKDEWPIHFIHNDIYEDNLLIQGTQLYLIDWEYAGDSDIGFDLCKLFTKNGCPIDEIDDYLELYYMRKPTTEERTHIIGCAVVSYYFWYVWAIYMTQKGNDYSSIMFYYNEIMDRYLKEYQKQLEGGL